MQSISPGIVKTPILKNCLGDEVDRKCFEKHPHLQSDDIASAVEYILGTPAHVQVLYTVTQLLYIYVISYYFNKTSAYTVKLSDWPTDRLTDQPINRPTDQPTVRMNCLFATSDVVYLPGEKTNATDFRTFDISTIGKNTVSDNKRVMSVSINKTNLEVKRIFFAKLWRSNL